MIASSSLDSTIRVWDSENGALLNKIEGGPIDIWSVAFSPDDKYVISGSSSGKINMYNIQSGSQEQTFDTRGKFTLSIAYVSII